MVAVRGKSANLEHIQNQIHSKSDIRKSPWLEWNPARLEGKFLIYPQRDMIPERINEQLIVELYSK